MPGWLPPVLRRVADLARRRQVSFTLKAKIELNALGIDAADACGVLTGLTEADSVGRVRSRITGEWMYVFKPRVGDIPTYVKLVLRHGCVVVSFHGDSIDEDDEGG
jgi:hypothetical protein